MPASGINQLFYKNKFISLLFVPFNVFWNSSRLTKALFSVGIVGGLLLLRNKNSSSFGHHKKLTPLEIKEIENKRDRDLQAVKNKITEFKQNYLSTIQQNNTNELTNAQPTTNSIKKQQKKLSTEISNLLSELQALDYQKEQNFNRFISFRTDLANITGDFQNILRQTILSELGSSQN